MIKNLLSLALMSSLAIGANAYNVDDMIYTRAAKYKVTAANLVTNGELKGASLDGWTATDATVAGLSDVFTVLEDGGVKVNAGMTALGNGMYQVKKKFVDKGMSGDYYTQITGGELEDGDLVISYPSLVSEDAVISIQQKESDNSKSSKDKDSDKEEENKEENKDEDKDEK